MKPEFWQHYQQTATELAAEQIRRQALPKAPDYKPELPKDFVLPQGMQYEFDANAETLGKFREYAVKAGLNQEQFSEALGLYAGMQVAEQARSAAILKADMEKLGANRDARMTAIRTWLDGTIGEELGKAAALVLPYSSKAVEALEAIISKHSSQGAASFRQDGRAPPGQPGRVSEEAYGRMSQAERWNYAKSFPQDQFRNGGR